MSVETFASKHGPDSLPHYVEIAELDVFGLNSAGTADCLAASEAAVVLVHHNLPATGTVRGVREVAAPTTCSFLQSYLLCETTPSGTTVRQIPVVDEAGLERGHHGHTTDSTTARGLTAIAAARVASFPLVDQTSGQEQPAGRAHRLALSDRSY